MTEAIGPAYIAQIISIETGAYSYLRNFKLTDWHWTEQDNIAVRDTRHERDISRLNCFVCNTEVWLGTVTCTKCYKPIIHEEANDNGFVPFHCRVTNMSARSIKAWTTAEQEKFKEVISTGRRLAGLQFNVAYGIRPPSAEEKMNQQITYQRSFKGQGVRGEGEVRRRHNMEVRRGFTVYHGTVEDRIMRDKPFREKLVRAVVNCSRHYSPAMVLLSKYHRLAYTTAIRRGEFTYERAGGVDSTEYDDED